MEEPYARLKLHPISYAQTEMPINMPFRKIYAHRNIYTALDTLLST